VILSIVVSKADAKECRISTDSELADVLVFLKLLGVTGWTLRDKGYSALELNRADLFVAIGPLSSADKRVFLSQAETCYLRQDE
jgi:hypothetical protein